MFPNISDDIFDPPGWKTCSCTNSLFCHSSHINLFSSSSLESFPYSTFSFKVLQSLSIGFKSEDVLDKIIVFTFFYDKNSWVIFSNARESLSRWKLPLLTTLLTLGVIFALSVWVHKRIHCMDEWINVISPVIFASPFTASLQHTPTCFTVVTMQSQVHGKHPGPHLIQTHLFWFNLTEKNELPMFIRLLFMVFGKV